MTYFKIYDDDGIPYDISLIDKGDGTFQIDIPTADVSLGNISVSGITIADGADSTQGAKADPIWDKASPATIVSLLKYIAASGSSSAALPDGIALDATLQSILSKLSSDPATQTTLAALNTKIPSQGQAVASASLPVVLPTAQITTLTPPAAITNYANETGGNLASIKTNTDKIPSSPSTAGNQTTLNTAIGSSTDSAASNDGSLIAIIKYIRSIFIDVWDSVNHRLNTNDAAVTALSRNNGTTDSGTLRVITATDGPLNTNLGATTDAAITTNTTGSVSGKLRGLVAILSDVWDSTNHWLKVQLAASESHIGEASAWASTVDLTITRPADTNAYAANDEWSDSTSSPSTFTLSNMARTSGGSAFITDVTVIASDNLSTKPQLLIFLFDTSVVAGNDNAAFAPSDSVMNTLVAVIPINVWYNGDDTASTGNAVGFYLGPPVGFKTSGSANLYMRVKVLNAPTPTSASTLKFRYKVRS